MTEAKDEREVEDAFSSAYGVTSEGRLTLELRSITIWNLVRASIRFI